MPELLITIVIMGILAAIAIPSWFGLTEHRAVDSATNQLVADMRRAHSTSTNQLQSWQVVLTPGQQTYRVGASGSLKTRTLPDNTRIGGVTGTTITITFNANGSASSTLGNTFVVRAADGYPSRTVTLTLATSRVKDS